MIKNCLLLSKLIFIQINMNKLLQKSEYVTLQKKTNMSFLSQFMFSATEEPLPPPPPPLSPFIVDSQTQTESEGSENSLMKLNADELRRLIVEERFHSATLDNKNKTLENENSALTKQNSNAKVIAEKILKCIDERINELKNANDELKRLREAKDELEVTKNQFQGVINNLNDVIRRQHKEICMWHESCYRNGHSQVYFDEEMDTAYSSEEEEEENTPVYSEEEEEVIDESFLDDSVVPIFMEKDFDYSYPDE